MAYRPGQITQDYLAVGILSPNRPVSPSSHQHANLVPAPTPTTGGQTKLTMSPPDTKGSKPSATTVVLSPQQTQQPAAVSATPSAVLYQPQNQRTSPPRANAGRLVAKLQVAPNPTPQSSTRSNPGVHKVTVAAEEPVVVHSQPLEIDVPRNLQPAAHHQTTTTGVQSQPLQFAGISQPPPTEAASRGRQSRVQSEVNATARKASASPLAHLPTHVMIDQALAVARGRKVMSPPMTSKSVSRYRPEPAGGAGAVTSPSPKRSREMIPTYSLNTVTSRNPEIKPLLHSAPSSARTAGVTLGGPVDTSKRISPPRANPHAPPVVAAVPVVTHRTVVALGVASGGDEKLPHSTTREVQQPIEYTTRVEEQPLQEGTTLGRSTLAQHYEALLQEKDEALAEQGARMAELQSEVPYLHQENTKLEQQCEELKAQLNQQTQEQQKQQETVESLQADLLELTTAIKNEMAKAQEEHQAELSRKDAERGEVTEQVTLLSETVHSQLDEIQRLRAAVIELASIHQQKREAAETSDNSIVEM